MSNRINENRIPHFLNLIFFSLILISAFVFSFLISGDAISLKEKRKLTVMPDISLFSVFDSKYQKTFSMFYEDNFPFRDDWLKIPIIINSLKGLSANEGKLYTIGITERIPKKDKIKFSKWVKKEQTTTDSSRIIIDDDGVMVNNLLIYNKRAYQLFGGCDAVAKIYAESVNDLKKALGDSITLYNLLIPSPAEFYLPIRYKTLKSSEKHNLDIVKSNLNSKIIDVNAYEEISRHTDEYLYFATDHHWTVHGAYCAYKAFAKSAKFSPISTDVLTMVTKKNYLGSLYLLTLDASLASNPDSVSYYKIPGNYSVFWDTCSVPPRWYPSSLIVDCPGCWANYGVFLGEDFAVMKIETNNFNNRRILVLKESFGNAFIPFLVPHYEKVFVADIRYFKYSLLKFIKEYKINEVLVIMSDISANNTYFGYKLRTMPYSGYSLHYGSNK